MWVRSIGFLVILELVGCQEILAQDRPNIALVPQVGPSGIISSVAYSADGARVISTDDNSPKLWDVATGVLLREFRGHTSRVNSAAISPDGTRILSGDDDKKLKLWDAATGTLLRTLEGHADRISSVAFSPDGKRALSGERGDILKLWDITTGAILRTFDTGFIAVQSVAFSPDGRRVLAGRGEVVPGYSLNLWDASTGALVRSFKGHSDNISAVAYSPDGKRVLSGSWDGTVKLWEVETGRLLRTFKGPSRRIETVAFTRDGARVLAGADNGYLLLWSAATGALLHRAQADADFVNALAPSPDGKFVLSGGRDGTLKVWDAESLTQLTPLAAPADGINSVTASPDGSQLLSGSSDQTLKRWDLITGGLLQLFDAEHRVLSTATSPDGSWFLSADTFGLLKLWEASTGTLKRTISAHSSWAHSATFSPDGKHIISGSHDKTVKIWNVATGALLRTFSKIESRTVGFSTDGRRALSSDEKSIKLFDMATGALLHTLPTRDYVRSAIFTPDGSRVVSASGLWDANTGTLLRSFGFGSPYALGALSPDGNRFASGDGAGTIRLWDINSGRLLLTIDRAGEVNSVTFARGGSWLASGSSDGLIRIWDIASGQLLVSLLAKPDGEWLAITPEGFFAGSAQGAEMLSVVRGLEVYSIDQFFQALYRPDLVREKLAGDALGLVREAARLDLEKVIVSGAAPKIAVVAPRSGDSVMDRRVHVAVDIADTGGGIGRIEWRINGVTVGVDEQSTTGTPPVSAGTGSLRFTRELAIDVGENTVEVLAYNRANLVASRPARVALTRRGQEIAAASRLFVLAVGLNDYADTEIQLKFAVADAQALGQALTLAGKGHYSTVHITLMRDAEVKREGVDAAFAALAEKVQPEDAFVFFLAGHGKTIDGRYYFIPQNADLKSVRAIKASSLPDDLKRARAEAELRRVVVEQGIAQEQWQSWFARIAAKRSLLMFDTCESGSLIDDGRESRMLERDAASGRLARATGRTILTAASDDQDANEGYRGHGLFTYNVLEALERADSDRNGKIEVAELAAYVYAQVPALSEQVFPKRQVPQVRIAGNYALANQAIVMGGAAPSLTIATRPTHVLSAVSELFIQPGVGATSVRKLDAKTPVTLIKSEVGWTLVALEGRPIGYVAARDLRPIR